MKSAKPRRPSQTHIVQPGETLRSIASMHGMHVMEIRVLNNIWRNNIVPGTELLVHHKPQRSKSLPILPFTEKMEKLKVDDAKEHEHNLSPQPEQEDEVVANKPLPWWHKATKRMKLGVIFESQPQSEPHNNQEHDHVPTKKKKKKTRRSTLRSKSERLPTSQEQENEVYALPKLIGGLSSDILSNPQHTTHIVPKLEACLPMRCRGYDWQLLYSSNQHGSSLHSLMRKVRDYRSTLIIIETCEGEIFGGFASSPWTNTLSYYGNGESFVFSATPKFEMYSWKRSNTMFMLSNDQSMAMGGGGGFAWYLNADLSRGTTTVSETFMNRSLASTPEFEVASVEVWGFVL